MTNEAKFNVGVQIVKGNIMYRSLPTTFQADVTGTDGPSPGAVTISTAGTDVDFSELTTPAICVLHNLDQTNFVEYGIIDGSNFYALGELLPGEIYVLRLSRNMTGFHLVADTAAVVVVIEAFET